LELFKNKIQKKKKKLFPEFPGFEPGNSDPIANHITTRPFSHYRVSGQKVCSFVNLKYDLFIRVDSALGW
jgi:hypothetical protein